MKKLLLILTAVIILISCTKIKKETYQKFNAYVKEMDVWAIEDENDFGKKISDINGKINLFFGDPVTIISEKNINNMNFCRIRLKNKKEYWLSKDNIAEKFIVIKKAETLAYAIPDENYFVKTFLQPGDFGILLKTENEWLNVNFWAFREKTGINKKEFVGNMWIKKNDSFTENIESAKEAYFLYFAYYYYYSEKNLNVANNFLEKALQISKVKKKSTEVTPVILEFKKAINN